MPRSTFFKWDRPSRRRNDKDEGFSEETDLESYADDYFSDTDSDAELFGIDTDEDDEDHHDNDNDNDNDNENKVECLDLWENGYMDPLTTPAAEPFLGQDSQEMQLSRKLTNYDDFDKAWNELHELSVFERDVELEKDESIWEFIERMHEEVDSGTDYAVARWAWRPESDDGLHAGKRCGKTHTAQDITDCHEKREDGDTTECDNNHSDSDQATVQGCGSGDDSDKNKDVESESASGYGDDDPVYSHGVEAIKAAQV
ncbi:hypothetical protein BGX30_005378 [Mortierella sp. GBA39]|nr:hypothetical protein BGX30_005378 [Mortierella sp. GBA39]